MDASRLAGLVEASTLDRLAQADAARGRRTFLAELEPGTAAVVLAEVRGLQPARTYKRRNGTEGLLARVTLGDESGELDLVLWDDEVRLCRDGPLQPGNRLRLHGPSVKAGFRGGVELSLGNAEVVPLTAQVPASHALVGVLTSIGDVRPVGAPPAMRFTCDLVVALADRIVCVTVWDEAVKQARAAGPGAAIHLPSARPNPFLDGWWTADRLAVAPASEGAAPLAATPK